MTEAEYYKLTKPERDEWVTDVLLGGDGIIVNHEDYNTTMQVIEKMENDGWWWQADRNSPDAQCLFFFKKVTNTIFPPSGGAEAKNFRDAVYLAAGRAKGVLS